MSKMNHMGFTASGHKKTLTGDPAGLELKGYYHRWLRSKGKVYNMTMCLLSADGDTVAAMDCIISTMIEVDLASLSIDGERATFALYHI